METTGASPDEISKETTGQTSTDKSDETGATVMPSIDSDHAMPNRISDRLSSGTDDNNNTHRGSSSEESPRGSTNQSSKESSKESSDDLSSGLPTQSALELFETPSSLNDAIYKQSFDLPMNERVATLNNLLEIFATYQRNNDGYLPGVDVDDKLAVHKEADFSDVKDYMAVSSYRLFFSMWYTWLGPSIYHQTIPPPELMLKKWNDIHTGPMSLGQHIGQDIDKIRLDDVIVEQLQAVRGRFQKRCRFLLWALAKTDDEDVMALINLILVALHGLKAIHRGRGRLEIKSDLQEDFTPCVWDQKQGIMVPGFEEEEEEEGEEEEEDEQMVVDEKEEVVEEEEEEEDEQEPAKVVEDENGA